MPSGGTFPPTAASCSRAARRCQTPLACLTTASCRAAIPMTDTRRTEPPSPPAATTQAGGGARWSPSAASVPPLTPSMTARPTACRKAPTSSGEAFTTPTASGRPPCGKTARCTRCSKAPRDASTTSRPTAPRRPDGHTSPAASRRGWLCCGTSRQGQPPISTRPAAPSTWPRSFRPTASTCSMTQASTT